MVLTVGWVYKSMNTDLKNKSKVKLLQTSGTEESMHPYLVWKHSTIQILLIDKNIKSSLNSTDLIVFFQNTGLMKLIKYKASNDKKKKPKSIAPLVMWGK